MILALLVFIIGYILITLEHRLSTNKSGIALAVGGILWVIVALSGVSREIISHDLEIAGAEIFAIVAFLLAAMALVEVLIHYRFFDLIKLKLAKLRLKTRSQFLAICLLTFFLSAILDNLTITIVMIQIARKFFKDQNLLVATAGIVILANAGGAWSPIGDVTTIMLWLAQKFDAFQIITEGFLPALAIGLVSAGLLVRQIKDQAVEKDDENENIEFSFGSKLIIGTTIATFSLPLIMNLLGLQPYIGLLLGLGVVWTLIEFAKVRSKRQTHLTASIELFLQKVDISSLKFFIGILLSVSALHTLGALELMSDVIFGQNPEFARIATGNILLGGLSAIVDNVPLTALAIDIIDTTDQSLWVLLALAAGTGGSFLVIGSVAGVIAMGMVKELTFGKYLKIATLPAILGYMVGIGVWFLQRSVTSAF